MPTPKSSNEGNTTKLITDEMVRSLPMAEVLKLRQEGWEYENPPKPWTVSKDDSPDTETYFAHTVPPKPTDPKLQAALDDPELKKIADQIDTTPRDLLLLREMMLDRHGHHEVDDED